MLLNIYPQCNTRVRYVVPLFASSPPPRWPLSHHTDMGLGCLHGQLATSHTERGSIPRCHPPPVPTGVVQTSDTGVLVPRLAW